MANQEAIELLYRWHAEVTGLLLDENNHPSESLRKELKEQQAVFLIAIKAMLEVDQLREALKGAMVVAEEAQGVMKAKREGRLIELPVPIGGIIYLPYKIQMLDGSIDQGVEEGRLTGYIDEGERKFYTYCDGAECEGNILVNRAFKTRREALDALETMEVN